MTRTLLSGGQVFDGTGAEVADGDVVVEDGRIVDIGTGLDGDERVDVSGLTVLPGLIDCHVHVTVSGVLGDKGLHLPYSYGYFEAVRNLAATLDCGVTTVRDAGGADLGVRRAVEDGLIEGPRLRIAITILSQTGGHADGWLPSGACAPLVPAHEGRPDGVVDGPEEMRKRAREIIRAGADVLKVCTSGGVLSPRDDPRHAHFRADELDALVAEATAAGLPVMAHAQATDGIKNAVRAGIRSIEHGIFLDDEAIDMMLAAGTWLVPTLVAPAAVLEAVAAGVELPESVVVKAREVIDVHRESFTRAVAAGVRIAMGTDSGVGPHGRNLEELALMAAGGMKPPAVLAAATSSAAELLGVADSVGTLTPGRRADLLLVSGDPYDFTDLRSRVHSVYQDGRRVRG
ncbi:metal-dependent hydrolase family protein [Phaeacidiphilus oryzae]|uniref:metal-dependent hydrolase family protein n=1 Tax=Phaeacidiphilus oryzae TaxID=348818 RepID=UPI00055FDE91|nr:amidohydrolase family protein [Phaeacidiphilus oryzae]